MDETTTDATPLSKMASDVRDASEALAAKKAMLTEIFTAVASGPWRDAFSVSFPRRGPSPVTATVENVYGVEDRLVVDVAIGNDEDEEVSLAVSTIPPSSTRWILLEERDGEEEPNHVLRSHSRARLLASFPRWLLIPERVEKNEDAVVTRSSTTATLVLHWKTCGKGRKGSPLLTAALPSMLTELPPRDTIVLAVDTAPATEITPETIRQIAEESGANGLSRLLQSLRLVYACSALPKGISPWSLQSATPLGCLDRIDAGRGVSMFVGSRALDGVFFSVHERRNSYEVEVDRVYCRNDATLRRVDAWLRGAF